jgi:hypothetical protein
MLDLSEGFVILVDPGRPDNDKVYENLFLALKQGIRPRAMNKFYREVKAQLAGRFGAQGGVMGMVGDFLKKQSDQAKFQEGVRRKAGELQVRLDRIQQRFADPASDFRAIVADDGEFLDFFNEQLAACFPKECENAKRALQGKEGDVETFKKYFLQEARFALREIEKFASFVHAQELMKTEADDIAKTRSLEQKKEAAQKVRGSLGIKMDIDIEESLPDNQEFLRFKNLKYIALAVTKSDMYPIVYPPEEFPRKKLPICNRYLQEIDSYLRILGGTVRYYNTSATGYSTFKNVRFIPGHENTLTPINVIEPMFDMLEMLET